VLPKNGNSEFFSSEKTFGAKRPNAFFKANQLEMKPKGQIMILG